MSKLRVAAAWTALAATVLVPMVAAAMSPLLAWREPVYIIAGFAGVTAMALVLFQPLLAAAYLPGLSALSGRRLHRWVGSALLLAVVVHVLGLWITSPPDVIDALLFASPTAFSVWGVIAMWAVLASASLAALRRRMGLRPRSWRRSHKSLAMLIVAGTVVHALLIEGTMESLSKAVLSVFIVVAAALALTGIRLRR